MPQQPRRLLERGVFGKLPNRIPGDDEFATFAIDVTEPCCRRDDAFESSAHHGAIVRGHV